MRNLSVSCGTSVVLNFIGGYGESELDDIPNNKT